MDEKELFLDELNTFEEVEIKPTKKTDKAVGVKASALKFFQSKNEQNSENNIQIQESSANESHFAPTWHKVEDSVAIDKASIFVGQEETIAFLDDSSLDKSQNTKGRIAKAASLNERTGANNESQEHFGSTQHDIEELSFEDSASMVFANDGESNDLKELGSAKDKEKRSAMLSVHQQKNERSQENIVPTWHEVKTVEKMAVDTTQDEYVSLTVQELFVDEKDTFFEQGDVVNDFVDETVPEDFPIDKSLDTTDPYIYFDYDKSSAEKANHDKMALRQVRTEAGGGAMFQAEYTKNGKLVSKIKLDEKQAVPLIRLEEFERDIQLIQDVKSDEESSDVSKADSMIEAAIYYSIDKTDVLRSQYKEVRKDASKEEKQLKKEIREDELLRRKQEAEVKKYFPESVAEFRDDADGFSNIVDTNFKNEREYIDSYFSNEGSHEEKAKRDEESQNESFQGETSEQEEFEKDNNRSQSSSKEKDEHREMTKEEKLEQAKSKKKAAKKSENSAIVKMARRTAVGIFIKTKKAAQDEAENMNFQSSGDLVKDGASGLLQSVLDVIKQALSKAALMATASIGKFLTGLLGPVFLVIVGVLLAGVMLINVIGSVAITIASFQSDEGIEYDLDVEGDGMAYAYLSAEQIDAIIESLYATYPDMSYTQETLLRYSLSKVGCAYDQDYHSSLTVDIFDCSSLAYRSYLQVGIDIAYENLYTAAYECYAMEQQNKIVVDDLQPGDLIFYGGANNNRYLGIYHVAIYVGKIDGVDKMVEARGVDYGVLYCDVRTSNVVRIARPY